MSFDINNDAALQSVLAAMETERKRIAAAQTKGFIAIGAGVLIGAGGYFSGLLPVVAVAAVVAVIIGIVLLYRINDACNAYKEAFKQDIIGAALKSFDTSLSISSRDGVQEPEFINSQLCNRNPDRYHTEDLVTGSSGKTRFYFAEVHAEYKVVRQTKNGTRTDWYDIFKGIIFVADFNKNFRGVTRIHPKDAGAAISAWFSKHLFSFGDKDLVSLENPDFNKTFVTYSTDQVEARYILTPAMMERLLQLNRGSERTISLSFINSKMYIGFPQDRNCFEAPVFKTLLNPALLDQDIATIKFMYDIVQELDLNTRIWGKD